MHPVPCCLGDCVKKQWREEKEERAERSGEGVQEEEEQMGGEEEGKKEEDSPNSKGAGGIRSFLQFFCDFQQLQNFLCFTFCNKPFACKERE